MQNVAIIIGSTLSLLGQLIVLGLFSQFSKLRNGLIPRIILYLTFGGIIQTVGILCSSFSLEYCTIFAVFRIYGGLTSLFWSSILIYSIKQLFMVFNNDEFKDIRDILDDLCKLEKTFLMYSFGIPMIVLLYPMITSLIYQNKHQQYCLFYSEESDPLSYIIQLDLQKLLLWIMPISFYFGYTLSIFNYISDLLKEDDEKQEIQTEVRKLIKQIVLFPIITLICTFSFTIEDIQTLFIVKIGSVQTTISWLFLSFWGLLNCIAYLTQDSVQQQLRRKSEDQDY